MLILAAGSMLDQPHLPLIGAAAEAGFDGVGLRLSGEETPAELSTVRAAAERAGIVIHDTEVHRHRLGGPGPEWLIEATMAVGAGALLMVSDDLDPVATTEAVAAAAEACRAAGVRLAIEYMAWVCPDNPADAVAMANEAECDLVVDLLHHHRVGAGPVELDAVVASGRLGWVQLCDAPAAHPGADGLLTEARHERMPPGLGGLPLELLLAWVPPGTPISVEVQSDALLAVEPHERARVLHRAATTTMAAAGHV
jgi:sugar phosphate isomerase/epimerase